MADGEWSRRRVLSALGTAGAASLAGCSFGAPNNPDAEPTSADPDSSGPQDTEQPSYPDYEEVDQQLGDAESVYTQVYRDVVDSVVAIRVETLGGAGRGTGWLYDANYVVTNEHVVSDAEAVSVWFSEAGWREARIVGTDIYSDLAVLDVPDRPADARPLPLVDRSSPVGTRVMAIGNPFGLSGSLTTGVVSGINRTLPAPNGFSIPDAVQTDAAVNPGNSGGPLVNLDGEVVGVINSGGGDNIGFAISAALTSRVVPALIEYGEYNHSYLGIGLREVTPALVEANDLPISRGVYVAEVVEDGPSEGALRGTQSTTYVDGDQVGVGGDVIVRMDGTPIVTQQSLSTFLALKSSPGETVDVEVIRDGRRQTVQVTLGARPEN